MNEIDLQPDTTPGILPTPQKNSLSSERTLLVMGIAGLAALLMLIGVLIFEITEFHFYRQSPSCWPAKIQSK